MKPLLSKLSLAPLLLSASLTLPASAAMDLAKLLSLPHVNASYGFATWHISSDEPKSGVTDQGMDVLDVEQEPDGTLFGIYHATRVNNTVDPPTRVLCLKLAMAKQVEQPVWKYITDIDCTGASQGSIKRLPGGEYLVTYEKKPSEGTGRIHSFVKILYFPNLRALTRGRPTLQYSAPEWNGDPNIIQGTPNFRRIHYNRDPRLMAVEIGFHVGLGGRGINAIGVLTGFKTWTYSLNDVLNQKLTELGVTGSIGGRAYLIYDRKPYTVVEGQLAPGSLTNFRLFLYDETLQTVTPLPFTTPDGGVAFGNPKLSYIHHRGKWILVGSAFSFNRGPYGGSHFYGRVLLP